MDEYTELMQSLIENAEASKEMGDLDAYEYFMREIDKLERGESEC